MTDQVTAIPKGGTERTALAQKKREPVVALSETRAWKPGTL